MTAPEHGAQLRRNQQGSAKQPRDTERSFPPTHAPPRRLGMKHTCIFAAALSASAHAAVSAQDATIVYRLGRDTVAVEQFSRTSTRMAGESMTRAGTAIVRVQYELTLGSNGRATAAVIRRRQADGSPVPNGPLEVRFTFRADSARRESEDAIVMVSSC